MKKLNILYEDKYLIIVYKRHGLLTISRDNHNDLNLYDEVKEYEKKKNPRNKIFIVHRLDKDTSGLVLFAKNEKIKYYNTIVQNSINASSKILCLDYFKNRNFPIKYKN